MRVRSLAKIGGCGLILLTGAGYAGYRHYWRPAPIIPPRERVADPVLRGAVAQLDHPASYDASYVSLPYPGGDVPPEQGSCTDVVIRAMRNDGIDLQKLIHEDITAHPKRYPRVKKLDANIDHRRVPNQAIYFRTYGLSLPTQVNDSTLATWHPGDVVQWKIGGRLDHTGIISDRKNSRGVPLVIHNISRAAEDDVLQAWPIVAHFRYPKKR